ncbi:uncharacterized protein F5147DRAFT_679956 [Suillus discolor]|uniref:Uncharacterized protein n=1 Tax=Suillus discolor TaxID=1912936 RepID=A0A9P7JX97_9AGAM|nr:uncharacterized protein F5147DRAFT_679956 [Suillus discolor]KAG2113817.1 hypothetical protein F5147DRAFT_679956 [Suillus discolor]
MTKQILLEALALRVCFGEQYLPKLSPFCNEYLADIDINQRIRTQGSATGSYQSYHRPWVLLCKRTLRLQQLFPRSRTPIIISKWASWTKCST